MYKISWPNRITLTRILLVAPFVVALLYLQSEQWGRTARYAALGVYFLMAISDGLDGYLARKLNQITEIGKFLDPLADKILIFCSVILLAHEETSVPGMLLPGAVAVIAVAKDLVVVMGFCIIYFTTSQAYIDPRSWGKWCTATQLAMVLAVLLSPDMPGWLLWLPRVLWWAASILAIATAVHYCRLGMHFIGQHEDEISIGVEEKK